MHPSCRAWLGGTPASWSSSDPAPTLTPAPVPETPALSAAAVPGVFADGTVDVDRLAAAHARVTTDRTYTWVFRLTRTEPDTGVRAVDGTRRIQVGPDFQSQDESAEPR